MNIEEIRADIFRLFDLKIDKDDPIWAFLYANHKIVKHLEDILEVVKKENLEHHKEIKLYLEESKKIAKQSIYNTIEQLDLKIDEFNQEASRVERNRNELISYLNRFKLDFQRDSDEQLEKLSKIFDEHISTFEKKINRIVEAINYEEFRKDIEHEIVTVVKKSLREVRAGVAINKQIIKQFHETNERHEETIKKLNSRISTLTAIAIFQALLFGISIAFSTFVYFAPSQHISQSGNSAIVQQVEE